MLSDTLDTKCVQFIEDLIEVCKKHNLSLGHEDTHGGFIVEKMSEYNIEWLRGAIDGRNSNMG